VIRINLLPGKKPKRTETGQRHLVFMGVGLLVGLAGIVLVHVQAASQLDDIHHRNSLLQGEIDRLKGELGDYDKVKAQREELLKQRKTITALESNRTGPVFLLRELSEILTPGKGPTFDGVTYQENLLRDPNAGFNASWDTRRVWLESFEEDHKKVRVKGSAKSNEDVAEFLKRLNLSVFFTEVNPESTSQLSATGSSSSSASSVKYVNFNLSATVVY
jgi:type IV pilus assembly protein PilN